MTDTRLQQLAPILDLLVEATLRELEAELNTEEEGTQPKEPRDGCATN